MEFSSLFLCATSAIFSHLCLYSHITYTTMASIALARVYQQSFAAHPYFTLAVINGALNALGDTVAQVTQNLVRISVSLENVM